MNRITRMDPLSEDLFFEAIKPKKWDARIQWASAMLVAHVETDQGPDLRILRAELDDGSAHRVNAGPEDASAESMIFIDGNDLILSLSTTPFESGDASLVIGFELLVPVRVTACIVGRDPSPAIVLRNYAAGRIHVLNGEGEFVDLDPGTWAMQAAAVPDGIARSGILRFTEPDQGEQEHRRSA